MTRAPPLETDALLSGDRRAVARAISRIERGAADAAELRDALAPHLGRAHVVGLTGSPGAGKSTLVDALLGEWLARGHRVGVVAVDPSSPISGGALLGDRVRIGKHGEHPNVFVRSIASRGHLGGLSRTTRGIVDLLDAAGFDIVIVETVGAGQSEVEVAGLADTCIVACAPGLGDEVQAIKAGILEIADLLVVTKADLPAARSTARDLRHMTHLRPAPAAGGWQTPVLSVSAATGEGIAALVERIAAHGRALGFGRRLRRDRAAASEDAADAGDAPLPAMPAALGGAFARCIGIRSGECTERGATATLQVRAEHLADAGTCDRSVIFALAECALRLAAAPLDAACRESDAHFTCLRTAPCGEALSASAQQMSRSHDRVVYRVDVVDRTERPVATLTTAFRVGPAPRRD